MATMKKGKYLCHIVPVPDDNNKSKLVYTVYNLEKLLEETP